MARPKAKPLTHKFEVGRGSIVLSILGLISKGPRCGYQIAKELKATDEALDVPFGALYPLLERMEKDGLIKGSWKEGRGQHGLHVYGVTAHGKKEFAKQRSSWSRVVKNIRTIV